MKDSLRKSYGKQGTDETGVCELFEIQQEQTPVLTAVSYGDQNISYSELNGRANLLAAHLRKEESDSLFIGISSTRNIEMIIGLLAILKAGRAYLPLDPDNPPSRVTQLIRESGIKTLVCKASEFEFFNSLKTGVELLATDAGYETVSTKDKHFSELIYLMYTSGSTGIPKGVCMTNVAMVNLLHWQRKNSVAGAGTRTLQFSPLIFDVSFQEIFSTLTTGGELVLIDDDIRLDPQLLLPFMERNSISRIFLPFVALQMLTEAAVTQKIFPSFLKEIITAGEQLKITPQIIRFFSILRDCVLYNQYGPTETHVVTSLKLQGNPMSWPALPAIGYPIDHATIFILNDLGKEVVFPDSGEICIGGICLAKGYLNKSLQNDGKFIVWHHPELGDLRIYKTGDLGRRLADGSIEFIGRRDEQVKIRGYRVEPGEIEVLLSQQKNVENALVLAREDQPGEKKLIAYLVSSNGIKDTVQIRQSIEKLLPAYMMPSAFIWLDQWPKTSSGKIDRKALPPPEKKRPPLSVLYQAPVTKIEKEISACAPEYYR